jgi:hypothetical protein
MQQIERSGSYTNQRENNLSEKTNAHTDALLHNEQLQAKISFLESMTQTAFQQNRQFPLSENSEPLSEVDMEGEDNGLYAHLVNFSATHDIRIEDNPEATAIFLKNGSKGLHKRFSGGWVIFVKQSSSLQKSATLAHELAHHFTVPAENETEYARNESIAEGTAFIVCDYFGLDIGEQAFSYIGDYTDGKPFTPEVMQGIQDISRKIITGIIDAEL